MRSNLSKITLAASFGLAMAFTTSCSDDKDSTNWASCSEFKEAESHCDSVDSEGGDYDKCFMDSLCGDASWETCRDHYEKECMKDKHKGDDD